MITIFMIFFTVHFVLNWTRAVNDSYFSSHNVTLDMVRDITFNQKANKWKKQNWAVLQLVLKLPFNL